MDNIINKIRKYKVTFSFSIVFFIIGFLNLFLNLYGCRLIHVWNIVVGFVPLIISIFLLNLYDKFEYKSSIRAIVNAILILISIFVLLINFVCLIISESFGYNEDINSYSRIIRFYKNDDGIKHFPSKITSDIKNVQFREWSAVMQGGAGIYLYYDIDKSDLIKLDEQFRESSKYIFRSMEEINLKNKEEFYLLDEVDKAIEFGDKFILYIMESDKFSGEEYWNHGKQCGVVINKSKGRIVYFYEKW